MSVCGSQSFQSQLESRSCNAAYFVSLPLPLLAGNILGQWEGAGASNSPLNDSRQLEQSLLESKVEDDLIWADVHKGPAAEGCEDPSAVKTVHSTSCGREGSRGDGNIQCSGGSNQFWWLVNFDTNNIFEYCSNVVQCSSNCTTTHSRNIQWWIKPVLVAG